MRNALGFDTLLRSAPCQRKYVSCTASSASAIDPSMRYARPTRRRRYGSKLASGFDIALSEFTGRIAPNVSRSLSISAGAAGAGQSQPTEGHADQPHDHGYDAPG